MPLQPQRKTAKVKDNLNLKTTIKTKHNIGDSTMVADNVEARVLGIPGPAGEDGGGGIGDVNYTNFTPVPEDIGGIEAGETFDDVPVQTMWDKLLYPYQHPSFTTFYMASQSTTIEVGSAVIGGVRTFNWDTNNDQNVKPNTITILQGSTTIYQNGANDNNQDVNIGSDIIKTSASTQTWTIQSLNTREETISRNYSVRWRWANHFGNNNNTSLNESDILGLSDKSLVTGYSGIYSFSAGGGYKYICYPVAFGMYSKAVDVDTGFGMAMETAEIVNITNVNGIDEDYYVHRTTNFINGAIRIQLS